MKNILMVCLGNICRSPMAEALLQRYSNQHGLGLCVSSVGLTAMVGCEADPNAIKLMLARGMDISGHRPQQLTAFHLHAADLILVMDSQQQQEVGCISPSVYGKVHQIGRWSSFTVFDPYMKPYNEFEACFALIEQGLDDWQKRLWTTHV